MFDGRRKGLKKSRKHIEDIAHSLNGRKISLDEGKTIIADEVENIIGFFPYKLLIKNRTFAQQKEPSSVITIVCQEAVDSLAARLELINFNIDEFTKEYSNDLRDDKYDDKMLADASAFFALKDHLEEDISDLIISGLTLFVKTKYFKNSDLLGDSYHDKLMTTMSTINVPVYLTFDHFSEWEVYTDSGRTGVIRFLKLPNIINEARMIAKRNSYEDVKDRLSALIT